MKNSNYFWHLLRSGCCRGDCMEHDIKILTLLLTHICLLGMCQAVVLAVRNNHYKHTALLFWDKSRNHTFAKKIGPVRHVSRFSITRHMNHFTTSVVQFTMEGKGSCNFCTAVLKRAIKEKTWGHIALCEEHERNLIWNFPIEQFLTPVITFSRK